MVAVGIASQFEAAAPFRQLEFLKQAHAAEQPQGAIHGGQGHPFLITQEPLMHRLGAEVTALADPLEQGQHPLPLGGEPLAAIVQAGAQTGCAMGSGGRWGSQTGSPGSSQE